MQPSDKSNPPPPSRGEKSNTTSNVKKPNSLILMDELYKEVQIPRFQPVPIFNSMKQIMLYEQAWLLSPERRRFLLNLTKQNHVKWDVCLIYFINMSKTFISFNIFICLQLMHLWILLLVLYLYHIKNLQKRKEYG